MNILHLCDDCDQITNFSEVLAEFGHKIVYKYRLSNISLISYDDFIITADILAKYDENKSFFQKIESQNKPIIYVYHANNKPEDDGMKFFVNRYNLKFQLSDCSILETPNWNYHPDYYSDEEEAYSMVLKNGEGNCFVKNTKQFYIYKKGNVIIMHDLLIRRCSSNLIDKSRMATMVKYILQIDVEEENVSVNWLKNIKILDDELLNDEYAKNLEQQNKLIEEQNSLNNKMEANNYYKSLLYCSGDKLVEVVETILEEMLGAKIDDKDLKKQDLYFKLDEKNILVEVKGVNHPFQRDNISQVKRHIQDYAEVNQIYGADVDKLCKGVLILNPYRSQDLADKISKEFYSKEVIADAQYENICTLDTLTLLNYYSKWRANPTLINLKNVILKNTYNKPDYDDIINL